VCCGSENLCTQIAGIGTVLAEGPYIARWLPWHWSPIKATVIDHL
jgi:hypothetical protein